MIKKFLSFPYHEKNMMPVFIFSGYFMLPGKIKGLNDHNIVAAEVLDRLYANTCV
jgi:hypothetical protein